MTRTVKQVLERVRNKGFNDRCQQEKYADIDNQFVSALSVDQALKELEAIMQGVVGEPLVDDITWSPTLKDPYGRRHIMDTTKTPIAKTNINHGSYETIKRQYRRLRQALYGKEAEL